MGRNNSESQQIKLSPRDKAPEMARRGFLYFMLGTGIIAATDKTALEVENLVNNTHTTIIPAKGEVLRSSTKSIVLDLPGQNYDTDNNIDVLPSLDPLGVRTKVKLGNKGDPVTDLKNEILSRPNLRTMSWFCDSNSWPLAAQTIPLVSNQIDTEYIFLASTPDKVGHTKGPARILAEALLASGYGASPLLTGITDWKQFGNPFAQYTNPDAASAATANRQLQDFSQSERLTHEFASYLHRYNATHEKKMKIVYLLLDQPEKDPLVNEIQSVKGFLSELPIDVVSIGGGSRQGHDNPTTNNQAYNAAIEAYLAEQGRVRMVTPQAREGGILRRRDLLFAGTH